jgi:O-antigen/teichoic acid export membrane protein
MWLVLLPPGVSSAEPEIPLRPRQLLERGSTANPLPEGTLSVGAGLLVLGLTAYVFFVVAARALGPERYSSLSVLWTLVFFAAPGFLFPLEQEVSRAVSARRAIGIGGGPVIKRAAILGGALALGLAAVTLALSGPILDHLFDRQPLLLVGLVLSLPTYAALHLTRGALSGTGRFSSYGVLLGGDGLLRIVAAVAMAIAGVNTAGPYGLLISGASAAILVAVLSRQRSLLEPGPEAPWSELSEALGWLLLGSVLAQAFVNASVPLVKVLAEEGEDAIAGQFQAGLIITRVPLFLFQAVQASLLPKLAGYAASGQLDDFRSGLRRLIYAVIGIGIAATIGAFAIGPFVLRIAFGSEFDELGNADLGYLALAGACFMLSTALSQALIALRAYSKVAAGWALALVVFGLGTWLGRGLLTRVELGLVTGSAMSVLAMGLLLRVQMARGPVPATAEPLYQAISPEHEIIEP